MTVTYTVAIANPGVTGIGSGFIDAKRVEQYGVVDPTDPTKTITVSQSIDKKRGNLRYNRILASIMNMSNVQVLVFESTGATSIVEGSVFNMTLVFDSEAAVYVLRDDVELLGVDAITQLIAEALSVDDSQVCDYYAPGAVSLITELHYGKLADDVDSAKGFITVTRM